MTASTGGDIRTRIDSGYGELRPQEQRAADFILDHLDDLAVYSATEIATASGVSKATVSRLFRRLGFADAQDVREHARSLRRRGVPVGPTSAASGGLAQHLAVERANLDALLAGLGDGRLEEAAALVAAAREVVVIGFRNSYPVALHLRQQLAQARPDVRIAPAPGQSVGEKLAGLGPRDAVVLVGFRRRPAGFAGVLASLEAQDVPVVLVVDPAARLPSADSTRVLVCPVDSVAAFDSYAAAMSLANLLAAAVLAVAPGAGRARIGGITALYSELGELE
ncbi:MurR/RpiR family transcriptional regulator [Frondihabitans peucedani]|uniref:MurR/RpiR family transcriptional regulator n=1 Tax=Frondihabitans peucedani TaxID=598626 RepID=A0ABP8E5P6_9MICO